MSSCLNTVDAQSWSAFAGPIGSNAQQNYLTHSLLRYFGKLPPVLTGQILMAFARAAGQQPPLVLDLMCGSGTTLVEAQKLRMHSIGVDVNPLALLACRVKTRMVPPAAAATILASARQFALTLSPQPGPLAQWDERIRSTIPTFPNRDRWFPQKVQHDLAAVRIWIDSVKVSDEVREFLLLTWTSIIRQVSRASVRTGRIFYDAEKPEQEVGSLFVERLQKNVALFAALPSEHFATPVVIRDGDGRQIQLELDRQVDLALIHPPYFALYKYSSDVLRFELEWNRAARKKIAKSEIEDGFKTTRADLMYAYVADVTTVIGNAVRHTRPGGAVVVVIGNSTLSERQLPIVPEVLASCVEHSWQIEDVFERAIDHSQVKYHRSANSNIRSDSDYVLVIRK